MISFKTFVFESTETPLYTPKGNPIRRNPKYGVGKTMGLDTWVHKDYMHMVIPQDIIKNALNYLPKDFQYNTVKYNRNFDSIRFESSENFDTAREPYAGKCITVFPDGEMIISNSTQIYHHKWMWVLDDYTGFNVKESYNWSKYYLEKLKIVPRSGSQAAWDKQLKDIPQK